MDFFTAKRESPPWQSAMIAMMMHRHHGGQAWWARTTTDVQTTTGTRQTAYGAFFGVYAAYDGRLQAQAYRTAKCSGLPEFRACLSAAAPGNISSKPWFHPGPAWQKAGYNQAKQNVWESTRAALTGVAGRNSPHYAHYKAGWSGIRRKKQQTELAGRVGLLGPLPGYSKRISHTPRTHQRQIRTRI